MKIACLGWGSLIWDPRNLKIQNKWFEDGPLLPIEFTRISNNNRVTLIIDSNAQPVRTLWSLMSTENLEESKTSLKEREEVNSVDLIHHVQTSDNEKDQIKVIVSNWLKFTNLDAAIWTGLSFSKKTNNKRPSLKFIIDHLKNLKPYEYKIAEEYIRNAPNQIDTEYRREIEQEFGWTS